MQLLCRVCTEPRLNHNQWRAVKTQPQRTRRCSHPCFFTFHATSFVDGALIHAMELHYAIPGPEQPVPSTRTRGNHVMAIHTVRSSVVACTPQRSPLDLLFLPVPVASPIVVNQSRLTATKRLFPSPHFLTM